MAMVIRVRFKRASKLYDFDPNGLELHTGTKVVTETARGVELGECVSGVMEVPDERVVSPLKPIIRIATEQDLMIQRRNEQNEKEAFDIAVEKIAEHKLEMKLVEVKYSFDGSKILFFFTADGRVDFRHLVKDLASIFCTRIELRQIGVRDEAKIMGGLGICGRPFCCSQFLSDFQPVSIKMAKTQNISLNPTKISGVCGRLMCCLKYEQDAYEDLIRTSPKMESFVDTPEGRGTVVEIDLLRQRVKVRMEDSPETVGVFANTDIAVLRSGKARKNDPPIPADLAPISGNGKRVRKEEQEQDSMILEPIRFRYSTESVVTEEEPEQPEQKNAPSRRRRGPKNEAAKEPKPEQPPKPEKPKQKAVDTTQDDAQERPEKKPSRRRPNYRRRKPRSPGSGQENT